MDINNSIKGYALIAMKAADLTDEQIDDIFHHWDTSYSMEEAAAKYIKYFQTGRFTFERGQADERI